MNDKVMRSQARLMAASISICTLCITSLAWAGSGDSPAAPNQAPKIDWVQGPTKVDLGSNLAQVVLDDRYVFTGPKGARQVLESMGNIVEEDSLGLLAPKSEKEDWFICFDFDAVGYVKDDEKNKIDADALLKSIQEGTEERNKIRKERNISPVHAVGWSEAPHYDPQLHSLVWAILLRNEKGHESVNYNVRLLGRTGYLSITLVDSPQNLALSKPHIEGLLSKITFKKGKTYAEWVPGDKVAEYGLVGLVAAGAGAAAVKLGLFAGLLKILGKAWKLVVIAAIAVLAGLKKFISGLFGRSKSDQTPPAAPPGNDLPPQT